ncbi:hypothetical protein BTO30_14825, partial [Domibacillus antri]
MSAFGGIIFTNRGKNLMSKALAGVQLNFTRMAVGDGTLGSSSILALNALKREIKSLPIAKLKTTPFGKTTVGSFLRNADLTEGFYFREMGIFANDPDQGEILFCYANAGDLAEYIPPGTGTDVIEKNIDVQITTDNVANITAVIDESLVFISTREKGTAEGVATLDVNGRVPITQLRNLQEEDEARQTENIGYGVQSGLNTTASATPDMNVQVQPGVIYMPDGKRFAYTAAATITVTAADSTNPREDIIFINESGVIEYIAGTPAATPTEPALPAGAMHLSTVPVPAGATAIDQSMIIDKRKMLRSLPELDQEVTTHKSDTVSHVTQVDKEKWNAASPKSHDLEIRYWMWTI